MEELARAAAPDDLAVCARLLDLALAGAATMRGGPALAGDATPDSLLSRWTGTGAAAQLLVGEFGGAVVGLLAVTASPAETGAPRRALIECCYVEEEARGVGVGTALTESVVAWCTAQGCRDIDALALPGDRPSKQRLEAAGFTARLLVLSRPLS